MSFVSMLVKILAILLCRLTRAELSAIKGAIPRGHTVISELETEVLTKAIGSDEKTTYQIIGKDGVFDPQRVDPSGYAIMASNDAGRVMLEAHMMGGSKIDRDSFLPPEMQTKVTGSSKCRPVLVPTF